MIKQKITNNSKPVIDLTGKNGNAFYLLGTASKLAKQLGLDFQSIHEEMTQSDYENLILVFDKHFGEYVDLER